jgi:hypothetical protein
MPLGLIEVRCDNDCCGPNVLAHLPSIAGSALPKALALAHRSSPSAHDLGSYQAWCSLT